MSSRQKVRIPETWLLFLEYEECLEVTLPQALLPHYILVQRTALETVAQSVSPYKIRNYFLENMRA